MAVPASQGESGAMDAPAAAASTPAKIVANVTVARSVNAVVSGVASREASARARRPLDGSAASSCARGVPTATSAASSAATSARTVSSAAAAAARRRN